MDDVIKLTGLRVEGRHGVFEQERRDGQMFVVDVALTTDVRRAAFTDSVDHTINYAEVAHRVRDVVAGPPSNLIEKVAEDIARDLLAAFGPLRVEVTVHKPQAPIGLDFGDVSVTVARTPEDLVGETSAVPSVGRPADAHPGTPAPPPARSGKPATGLAGAVTEQVVLSLGSNLGDRQETLFTALELLDRNLGLRLTRVSPIVETKPVGGPEQPDYLNLVAEFTTSFTPEQLLRHCQKVEDELGRERTVRWGPRTLDIDIVTFGQRLLDTPELQLPHPRAHERAFVLYPWYLMDPGALLPPDGQVAELLEHAEGLDELVVHQDAVAEDGR